MRRSSIVLMVMLLTSAGFMAQSLMAQTSTHGTTAILTAGPTSESCPVAFFVSRMAAPTVMVAKDGKTRPSTLGLELNFARSGVSKIVKATITVHGPSGKAHLTPAASNTDTDMTETFKLRSDADAESLLHSAIWLKKMGAVSWVDLTEIEYANGSVWHASAASKCRAVPSNLLLVNAVAQ